MGAQTILASFRTPPLRLLPPLKGLVAVTLTGSALLIGAAFLGALRAGPATVSSLCELFLLWQVRAALSILLESVLEVLREWLLLLPLEVTEE